MSLRKAGTLVVAAVAVACAVADPSPAAAWTRTVDLGAAAISGDSSHRIMGTVTWQMPDDWRVTLVEGDSGAFRFWPATLAPGCTALTAFSFAGVRSRETLTRRLSTASSPHAGGRLIGRGTRPGGGWAIVRNVRMAEGLPQFPGAYYVEGHAPLKIGSRTWLDLGFYSFTSGSCSLSTVDRSSLLVAASEFVRRSTFSLRVAGKWPARG